MMLQVILSCLSASKVEPVSDEAISYFETQCDPGENKLLIFFAFSEVRPSRYISHLIGVFLKN